MSANFFIKLLMGKKFVKIVEKGLFYCEKGINAKRLLDEI
jgi:hypothetical protein